MAPLVFQWHALIATFKLATGNDEYTHILLILPISITLIFSGCKSGDIPHKPNLRAGVALLVTAFFIGLTCDIWRVQNILPEVHLSLSMLAAVIWWIGSFVLCFGASSFVFPLCFLLWLVPIPVFILSRIVNALQQGSALVACWLYNMVQIPVMRNGVTLSVPGLNLEIAKECSSIRSSLMLLVTATVLAYVWLRSGWARGLAILAAIPLAIAKNGIRVFTLSVLAIYVDPSFLTGRLHHQGGVLFFLLSLGLFCLLLLLLDGIERKVISGSSASILIPSRRLPMTSLRPATVTPLQAKTPQCMNTGSPPPS